MTSDGAKREACRAASEILRYQGYQADPEEIDREFSRIVAGLQGRYWRLDDKLKRGS